jgi:hypothetical protein
MVRILPWSLLCSALFLIADRPVVSAGEPAGRDQVFRWDPLQGKPFPVPPAERKPRSIYKHYSPRLGRWVWAFLLQNGQFSNALGPGTTQTRESLDLRITREQGLEALAQTDPRDARRLLDSGEKVAFELDDRGQWTLDLSTNRAITVFDMESGRRWQQTQWGYIPIVHWCGDRWAYCNGQYVVAD